MTKNKKKLHRKLNKKMKVKTIERSSRALTWSGGDPTRRWTQGRRTRPSYQPATVLIMQITYIIHYYLQA